MKRMRRIFLLLFFLLAVAAAPVSLPAALPLASAGESIAAAAASGNLADFRSVIAEAKRKVFPSVVFLMPISERYDGGKREKAQVAGSGVIVSPEGEIVTNWHVVDRAVEIRCLLYDGTSYPATIVGTDKDTDLALLRLDAPAGKRFPAASLADSSRLEAGQFVMAMGAPWGLSRSVSMGVLSCVDRFLPDQGGGYNLWLQTDASINPGNSGGPLVDTDGRVVGINSLGFLLGGNLAFAIPSNTVGFVAQRLRRDGRVARSWTGLRLQPLKDFEKNIFYAGDAGVLVAGVDPASPADVAGVRAGEMILEVNGRPVRGINHEDIPGLNQLLADLPLGRPARLRLASGTTTEVTPVEKGTVDGGDFDCRLWNMTIKEINAFAAPMLHFFRPGGVYVQGVESPGNAANAGLAPGDIILELDGVPVESFASAREMYATAVADELREKKVVVTVMRSGLRNYHVLDYAPRYGQD